MEDLNLEMFENDPPPLPTARQINSRLCGDIPLYFGDRDDPERTLIGTASVDPETGVAECWADVLQQPNPWVTATRAAMDEWSRPDLDETWQGPHYTFEVFEQSSWMRNELSTREYAEEVQEWRFNFLETQVPVETQKTYPVRGDYRALNLSRINQNKNNPI